MNLKQISWLRSAIYLWRNYRNKYSYKSGSGNKVNNHGGIRIASRIQFSGNRNQVVLDAGSILINSLIKIQGDNNKVVLKEGSYVSGVEVWVEDNNCTISVGENSFIGEFSHLACTENDSNIIIGKDCMISAHVQVRTGDSHSILDLDGKRLNPASSVFIGDHVWIGDGAKIMKGVTIDKDSIVSTGAIVTKSFGKNVLLGGIPAKVIKDNITWDKERI